MPADTVIEHRIGIDLDSLPGPLPPDADFMAPEEYLSDPGTLLAYTLALTYGKDVTPFAKYFNMSRQSIWHWRHAGTGGIPEDHRATLERCAADPDQPFRPASNATLDHYIKASNRRGSPPSPTKAITNDDLLNLLDTISTNPELGRRTLWAIVKRMSRRVENPFLFYRWGFLNGGVPRTYVTPFITALLELNIHELYDMDHSDFEAWARRQLPSPESSNEDG
jgi:hypothetical protein